MMHTLRLLATMGAAVVLAACASAAPRPDSALRTVSDELRQRVQSHYAEPFKAGEIERWTEVFAADALAYHDGPPPMKGRDAIRQFGQRVQQNFRIQQFDVVVDEVRTEGNWALTAGHYAAVFVPRSADAYAPASGPRQGKFLFLWERQQSQWRIIVDMGNSTDPPPASAR